jgi:hypothetical protein
VSDQKIEWLKQRPYLCVYPVAKYDFRIHHDGFDVSCCCNLDVKFNTYTGDTDLVDLVRKKVVEKKTHPACWKCHEEEANGRISERIRGLLHYSESTLKVLDSESAKVEKREIGFKISNLCNLACRSCQPQDSSTFQKITKLDLHNQDMTVDFSDMPDYWDRLLSAIQKEFDVTKELFIHPIGGETFIQPGFHKLLDWLIERDMAKHITLRVTTSLATPITEKLIEKFEKFQIIEFLVSIDSVGDNYYHVRWPAKFDKVQKNLDIVEQLFRTHPTKYIVFGVQPIFSLNNVFYLEEILDFWAHWIETSQVPTYMSTMHLFRPGFLMIDILPERYRGDLLAILKKCQDHKFFKSFPKNNSAYEYIVSTIEILEKNDPIDPQLFNDYLKFSADYDKRTGSNSFLGNKKLFDLLSEDHIEIYRDFYNHANPTIPIYYKIDLSTI